MTQYVYQYGDRVHHLAKPEWGIGSVIKVEEALIDGERTQRLSIRFPNAGLKSIIAQQANGGVGAEIRKVDAAEGALNGAAAADPERNGSRLAQWERMGQSDWLSPLAQRKIRETMTSVPEECTDAFIALRTRLVNTLGLYRFDKSGRGLIDWAVAQSGLDDPLTRFTRQELEQLYDRWTSERDGHLAKLLQAAQDDKAMLRDVLKSAPPAGQQALRKHAAIR